MAEAPRHATLREIKNAATPNTRMKNGLTAQEAAFEYARYGRASRPLCRWRAFWHHAVGESLPPKPGNHYPTLTRCA